MADGLFLPSPFDHEPRVTGTDRLGRFSNAGHASDRRPLREMAFEFLERGLVADGIDLYGAVPAVLDASRDAELMGAALGEKAGADSLNPAGDDVLPRQFCACLAHKRPCRRHAAQVEDCNASALPIARKSTAFAVAYRGFPPTGCCLPPATSTSFAGQRVIIPSTPSEIL